MTGLKPMPDARCGRGLAQFGTASTYGNPQFRLSCGVSAESYGFANKQLAWETGAPLLGRASPLRTTHLRDPWALRSSSPANLSSTRSPPPSVPTRLPACAI